MAPSTSAKWVHFHEGGGAIEKGRTNDNVGVDKRGERVRAMFASIAPRYDLLNHVLSLNIDKGWRRTVVRAVAPRDGDFVLDLCTGTGDLALLYAGSGAKELRVVGADFCPEMLDIARSKRAKLGLSATFQEEDAQSLSFSDGEFDIVTCAFGLRNIADTDRGLAEMVRVVRRGGTVAILEFSRPRIPGLRWLYLAYFKYLLPRIGQSVARNEHGAYAYLPSSVIAFPDGEEMASRMRDSGLYDVTFRPLTFGIATLYIGVKR